MRSWANLDLSTGEADEPLGALVCDWGFVGDHRCVRRRAELEQQRGRHLVEHGHRRLVVEPQHERRLLIGQHDRLVEQRRRRRFDGGSGSTSSSGGNDGGSLQPPSGVYVPTFDQDITMGTDWQTVLASPYVQGISIGVKWSDIEQPLGMYSFAALESQLEAVHAAGKKASLVIHAYDLPSMFCTQHPNSCHEFSAMQAASGSCKSQVIGIPWDSTYQAAFLTLLRKLGDTWHRAVRGPSTGRT